MLLHSPLTKILGQGALFLMVAATATGCDGCGDDATVQCDAYGENCVLCDGYGCHPAEPAPVGAGGSGQSPAQGGSGQGGWGQGGWGQGGEGGGEPACDDELTTCPCDSDDACDDGLRCIDGICLAACEFSYECGAGRLCVNGQCAEGCSDRVPCEAPGTVCDRGVCVPDPEAPECSDADPCEGAGERCVEGACTTACQAHADCEPGEICNAATGACMPDPSPAPGCAATGCAAQGQECMDDGYCHYPCDGLQACQRVDSRFVACEGGFCKTREEVAPQCTVDEPCPDGRDCISNTCL